MPRKHSIETKEKAVGMLHIHDDISLVHYNTGVNRRTLRRWRDELAASQKGFMSEKTFPSDIKRTQNVDHPSDSHPEDQEAAATTDHDDFVYIREQLMKYARDMASKLQPDQTDINRRTLALSRVLDRIDKLDRILPEKAKEQERPIWQDAYDDLVSLDLHIHDLIKIEKRAQFKDDRVKAHLYKTYAEQYREKGYVY